MGKEARRMEKVSALPTSFPQRSGNLPQHQRRVLRAEAHAVADGVLDLGLATDIGDVIEIALGVTSVEIDGRRDFAVLHSDQSGGESRGTTSALGVSDLRLQA